MAHRAGIDQLQHEQRLVLGRLGAGLDRQRDLEGLGVELAVGDLDVERELRLGLLDQALRRARVLEAQVLDVLAVHDQRRVGRLLGAAPCGPGGFCGGGGTLVMAYFLCCGRAVPCRAALHKPRAGAAGCHLQSPRPNKRIAGTFLHASARDMDRSSLRPLVGVTACFKENGRGGWHHTVGDKYVRAAVHAVGALPVLIPAIGPELGRRRSNRPSRRSTACSTRWTACC